MKISVLIIALLMVTGVVVGIYTFVNEMAQPTAFNVNVNQTYIQSFNKTVELNNQLASDYEDVKNLTPKTSSAVQIITLVPDALSIIKNVLTTPFTITGDILSSLQQFLHLPVWVYNFLIGIFTVVIIFGFISLILRWTS